MHVGVYLCLWHRLHVLRVAVAGSYKGDWHNENSLLGGGKRAHAVQRPDLLAIQATVSEVVAVPEAVAVAVSQSMGEYIQQKYKKEMNVSCAVIGNAGQRPVLDISPPVGEADDKQCICPASNILKYLDLEPSLAMDWLEICWDDLHLKERVGAGKIDQSTMEECRETYATWINLAQEVLKQNHIEKTEGNIIEGGDQIDKQVTEVNRDHVEGCQVNSEREIKTDTVMNKTSNHKQSGKPVGESIIHANSITSTKKAFPANFCSFLKNRANLK